MMSKDECAYKLQQANKKLQEARILIGEVSAQTKGLESDVMAFISMPLMHIEAVVTKMIDRIDVGFYHQG